MGWKRIFPIILLLFVLTACAPAAPVLPTPSPTPVDSLLGCVSGERLNVRAAPGALQDAPGELLTGEGITVDGRTAEGDWGHLVEGGWVNLHALEFELDAVLLPVITPAPLPTQTPILEPTATFTPLPAAGCPQGCEEPPPGCEIKGNISYNSNEKIYHVPGQEYYEETVINPQYGERWFCTPQEAEANGWRASFSPTVTP